MRRLGLNGLRLYDCGLSHRILCQTVRLGITHKPVGPGQPQENNQGNVSDKQHHVDHNERGKGRRKTGRER